MSLLSRLAVTAAKAYGALSSKSGVSASYLVVAGGGGGGTNEGGGGGAGGYLTSTATLSILTTYTVTVGAGGATGAPGANGSVSSIAGTGLTTISSTGGGGGGDGGSPGRAGGSGGGGAGAGATGQVGGTATSGQGNNGGTGSSSLPNYGGGGGGGAGAVGGTGSSTAGGAGGAGSASSISGSSVTYAGGGGGGTFSGGTAGAGGAGGGANGNSATAATANTGGGGGGGSNVPVVGGSTGGSGIVIISYTSATPKFVGGTLTTSGGNQIHTFTSSGTLSPLTPVTASYLVVAGGGGGGSTGGGGGGAGGYLASTTTLYSGATYVVTVGAGGANAPSENVGNTNGGDSVLSGTGITTITSTGGGRGSCSGGTSNAAQTGGSGGGGGMGNPYTGGASGTSGQGSAGGNGFQTASAFNGAGGGGGGASAVGANTNAGGTQGGNGGAGSASSISGSSVTYAGGGGGGLRPSGTASSGGSGGGGGGGHASTLPSAGTANTGGGGGGGGTTASGAGGSGTVIISYAGSQVFNGGLVTSSGGNTIHTFNATGALTPVTNNLNNSLRFRSSASAYLQRTPTVTGSLTTWTASCWYKNGVMNTNETLFSNAVASDSIGFRSGRVIEIYFGAGSANLVTTQVFRDPAAWYHIVVAVDTTQATAANRIKLYVNGNQVTAFSTATYPSQNYQTSFNRSGYNQEIGRRSSDGSYPIDGYFADINWVDGQALEPYYFGNNDAYGNWKPIKYTGMYGTNGYYLTFADTSALTTSSNAGLGKDTSGNGNYWATNGISITSGVTYDAMLDVPTNTSATVANYCVLNPFLKYSGLSAPTNGNLTIAGNSANWRSILSSFAVSSGKWYCEINMTSVSSDALVGIFNINTAADLNELTTVDNRQIAKFSGGYGYQNNGNKMNNNTGTSYGSTWTTADVIGIALDMDAGTITFYKNNTSQGTAYSSLSGLFAIGISTANGTFDPNFGQRPFTYTPPSGFVALNTYNLPTPTILQGNKYMDATLWTGDQTTRTITNSGSMQPDFVWTKSRSDVESHRLHDSVRGGNGTVLYELNSNETTAEGTDTLVSGFVSNGFTIASGGNSPNVTGRTYVGWQWQAGQGSTSSNTSGSITSTVSVNTTAGFSVVTYTGNGTTGATIGHGLGVAPSMIIFKDRDSVTNWPVYHKSLGNATAVNINQTNASFASTSFNSTTPTSTLITLGGNGLDVNNTSKKMLAYCWSEIAGFSKFGSYTGNGSTDGPFVYTGFRPKYVVVKNLNDPNDWFVIDSVRNAYNIGDALLRPNDSVAEVAGGSSNGFDLLSNGFKVRSSYNWGNRSGDTIVYMAFAENPFKNSNAR